ncbi:MAG TPA: sorbosone dehydrogenase family protein [Candidatus Acidoferrales bacterium]|nr:sorbosone dehydrogenase family protein [Candidatus Acidoferrales bacterium]
MGELRKRWVRRTIWTVVIIDALLVGAYLLSSWMRNASEANAPSAQAPYTDYRAERPGRVHRITINDLPEPHATNSVFNLPEVEARPADAWPQAPAGFEVQLYATGLANPRLIRAAPNGDLFLAESAAGRIVVFRGISQDGKPKTVATFASGLELPFGLAFYPPGPNPRYLYVANTGSVVRIRYQNGDLKARGTAETVVAGLPSGGRLTGGGHWTRDIAFSLDGKQMFVSVGSRSNVDDTDNNPREYHRADILEANPDGTGLRVYAWGIRNPVGIAIDPQTRELWASVNERDALGDDLPPDYITHIQENGFYGWPWYYIGGHQDPRHAGKHPELKDKVIVPDVLLEPHDASLEMTFYDGRQFPVGYFGNIFAAEHGSWNRSVRTGYEVICVPLVNGRANGEYSDFLTGFLTPTGRAWGRPVGVAVAQDGSLMVSDDGSNSIWRVRAVTKQASGAAPNALPMKGSVR